MKRFAYVVGLLFWVGASIAGASEVESDKEQLLSRALGHMYYAQSYKHGLRTEMRALGKTTPFIEAVLAADNAFIERIIASVYARRLTLAHAQAVASFYESDAGKALVRQQAQDPLNPKPKIALTPDQFAQARAFSRSSAGRELAEAMESTEAWAEIEQALGSALRR
ncbi:MAG: DUF2059 domain-containing protein [Burkholderiales bacterium]|nr:DUF2059 domain-containing protein [Burkholderiales bacterium]